MRSFRLALACLATLAFILPAQGAGISVANIGNASAAAGSLTLPITTTATCPAGSGVLAFAGVVSSATISSVTDTLGDTYSNGLTTTLSGTVGRQRFFLLSGKTNPGLASGSTITITYSATTGTKLAAAICMDGLPSIGSAVDTDTTGTTGASTTPSLTTAALVSNAEIIVCGYLVVSGAGDTFTNTSGFSPLTQVSNGSTLNWEYKIISSANAVTCAPTLGTSRTWGAGGRGYLQTQGVRALTGVGQ